MFAARVQTPHNKQSLVKTENASYFQSYSLAAIKRHTVKTNLPAALTAGRSFYCKLSVCLFFYRHFFGLQNFFGYCVVNKNHKIGNNEKLRGNLGLKLNEFKNKKRIIRKYTKNNGSK